MTKMESNAKSESKIILAVDIGTSETKATLISTNGLIDSVNTKYGVIYPKPGWAEQNPSDLSNAVYKTVGEIIKKHPDLKEQISGLTFTGQMQGVLPVDVRGEPLYNMMTWLDVRAADITKNVMFKGFPKISGYPLTKLLKFLSLTGGAPGLNGKDTISKIYWLKEKNPDVYNKTYKFLDTKDYAAFLATGKFITSIDTAYITWLLYTKNGQFRWSDEICKMYDLDVNKLCELRKSTEIIGETNESFSEKTGLPKGIPVINGAGDLLTSAIGSTTVKPGLMHANVGTAGWIGCHFKDVVKDIPHYVGTIASGMPEMYFLLCKQETLGGALDWAKNILYPPHNDGNNSDLSQSETPNISTEINLEISDIYQDMEKRVLSAPAGSNSLIFTPWLFGERSPVNDPFLRGQFFNIGMNHTRNDMIRSVFEGIAYNLRWGMIYVYKLSKIPFDEIKLIGGLSKSDAWCQIFADVTQKRIFRMKNPQMASAIGAACIAMVGLGIFKEFNEVSKLNSVDKEFLPDPSKKDVYDKIFEQFVNIYDQNKKIFKILNKVE